MMICTSTVLMSLPNWMDPMGSHVGGAELFFTALSAFIISVSVYLPWHLRKKKKAAKA